MNSSFFSKHAVSRPITAKLTGSIHMEDFPVATKESLAKLDVLKKEIMASDYGEKSKTQSHPAVKTTEHKESENHPVSQLWTYL